MSQTDGLSPGQRYELRKRALPLDVEWRRLVDPVYCAREGHLPVVTRDWRNRLRVRCWRCKLTLGPWRDHDKAEQVRKLLDGPVA
jgi:hypothetical protein